MSKSGIDTRSGLRKRSKNRPYFSGSTPVINSDQATAELAPEPRPGLPSGHIPGSARVPAAELLQGGRTMLPVDAIRARFAAAGVDGKKPVVTSCGTGVSAAILTFGLHLAGLPQGALYDGSWTEWAGRADTPKATGHD